METMLKLCAILGLGAVLAMLAPPDAEAKRLGGGGSFGGKSLYSSPYKRATPAAPIRQVAKPTPAQQKNAGLRSGFSRQGGLMGMLGGLALGGILGALFFGGAFEGINFFDILIFAALAFLAYKLISTWTARGRSPGPRTATPGGTPHGDFDNPSEESEAASRPQVNARRTFDTDLMFRNGPAPAAPVIPRDFDARAFLFGAERAYRQLQAAWDLGDLSELRPLTSDAVYQELERQLGERRGMHRTEIVDLDSELLEVSETNGLQETAVLFSATLRERDDSPAQGAPARVEEVWHFVRPVGSDQPTWFLDGIQQVTH